ncbi:MAG TPA: APC family permease [Hyphomicrobiaceae bacterium]|nr:APC family permease [Hyphomicrobiaceae bacterium]
MTGQAPTGPQHPRPPPAAPIGLRRSLGLTHAVLYGLGVTIGAGIYVLIAAAAGRAGMHAPIAFVVTAVLVGLTGASLAELGVRMPVAAGEAAFARAAFRSERVAAAVGLLVIAMSLVSASTISVGAAGYIGVFIDLPERILIAGVVLSMGLIATRGIRESVTFAGVMTLIEVGGLAIVIAAGFLFEPDVVTRAPEIVAGALDPSASVAIFSASMLAVFAFIGFEGIVNIAEEMKDPSRTMPRAIMLTLAITTVLYVLVMWVALAALGPQTLAASKAPLALVFEHLTGASPRTMSAIAIVATLNGIVVNMIMASRVMYGLSRQGNLPSTLGEISPATQTPVLATGLGAAIVLVFALLLPIAELADLSARLTLVLFAIVNLALYRIKSREDQPPPGIFRVPRWVPLLGFSSCILFIVADFAILAAPGG